MPEPTKFSLFKRSNGFYYILFEEDGRKRWKSTKCSLKSGALKTLIEFRQLLKTKPKAVTLSRFTSNYLEYARVNHAKGTVDIATIALKHLKAIVGDCLLTNVTPQHLDQYKSKRLGEVSPVSVNVELRALRAIMNVALRWRLLEGNPFAGMQLVRTPERPPSYLSKDDFQKLVSLIKDHWLKEVIVFAVLTGMRRAEIVNLRWENVDLGRKLIHVQSNGSFKTKQGKRRIIPIGDVTYHLLCSKLGRRLDEYVFLHRGRRIAESWLSHRFKHCVRSAGLPDGLHFHSLRHTFASWLVQDGVSLYEVQKLLGHSSILVTQVYSHLQPEQLHETVNRLKIGLN